MIIAMILRTTHQSKASLPLTDVHTPARRSYNMSMIRGTNTGPEVLLRKALWRLGFRYRLAVQLPGRPDLVLPKYGAVVFIDGCFWHGCPKHLKWPKNNASFWMKKILGNKARDAKITRALRHGGWNVIRVWEHEIAYNLDNCARRVQRKLHSQNS